MNRLWVLMVVVVLAACEAPVDIGDYCEELTRAECEAQQNNCGLSAAIDCSKLEPRGDCLGPYRQELRSGDMSYDPATARQCVEDVRNAKYCSLYFRYAFDSCDAVVQGNGDEGAPCGTCKVGLYCSGQGGDACGVCLRAPASSPGKLGETCFQTLDMPACRENLWCRRSNEDAQGVCEALPGIGESCEGFCGEGLLCRSGTCERLPLVGEPCDVSCAVGLVCRSGLCTALATVGEPCEFRAACEQGLTCAVGTCAVPRPLGAACDDDAQCDRTRCVSGKCWPGGAAGDSCLETFCGSDLQCLDGVCAALPTLGGTCQFSCADGFVCIDNACAVKPRSVCR